MACTCLDDFDVKLSEHNTRLVRTFVLRPQAQEFPKIAVEKINPRNRAIVTAIPTFCPFCGTEYALQGGRVEIAEQPLNTVPEQNAL
ncbi:hypothetical protein [Brevundimonas nasdae]|uniref:hypothetical protein n=1 Tax=Brevundimonas nasdae TaxID=172043 RepID=UPI003F68DCB1